MSTRPERSPPRQPRGEGQAERLAGLLQWLRSEGYSFITPTPETHRTVVARQRPPGELSLRDIFGWSLPFLADTLPAAWRAQMEAVGVLGVRGDQLCATVRVSSLGDDLFVHSAFPTSAENAVFFGPDTYRFARFLTVELKGGSFGTCVDLGAGSGAGAIAAARACAVERLFLLDVNPHALDYAAANMAAAGLDAELRLSDGLEALPGGTDLLVANPPYIAGRSGHTYRDGGDMHGAALSLDWALEGASRLNRGGRLLLYTGVAMVAGRDPLHEALLDRLDGHRFELRYEELDVDIFGEQLRTPEYADVERIAAVGLVITAR